MLKILKSRKTQERKWMSSTLRREKKKKTVETAGKAVGAGAELRLGST